MCPEYEILSAYIDGEVPFPWNKQIEEHLSSCKTCSQKVESYRKVQASMLQDSEPDYSPPMQRIWNKISELKQSNRYIRTPIWKKKISIPVPLAGVAAALVIFIGFLLVFNVMKSNPSSVNIITHKDDGSMTEVNITANDAEEIQALLRALESNSTPNEVIIQLPEGSTQFQVGEPELIRAVDFKRKR